MPDDDDDDIAVSNSKSRIQEIQAEDEDEDEDNLFDDTMGNEDIEEIFVRTAFLITCNVAQKAYRK